jgi:hypothetical protein
MLAAAAGLAACGQSDDGTTTAKAVAKPAAPKVKHPTYCFFKDANRKGWAASTDKDGNVTVKGKAYLEDGRYKGELIQGETAGDKASIWLQMSQNDTGFSMPDGWWDVSATIPNSAAAKTVTVMCGTKTAAALTVKR